MTSSSYSACFEKPSWESDPSFQAWWLTNAQGLYDTDWFSVTDAKYDKSPCSLVLKWSGQYQLNTVKGTVHPQIKVLASFTRPHVVPNLFSVEHKVNYFKEWTKNIMEVNGCLVTNVFQNACFVSHFIFIHRRNNQIQVLKQFKGE